MRVLLVLGLLLLAACAGKPPETLRYLLRSEPISSDRQPSSDETRRVSLGKLTVASYIDHPGLMVETDHGAIRAARYQEWAEPLRDSLRPFLAIELERQIAAPVSLRSPAARRNRSEEAVIDLHIDQLHGTREGDAILVAYWTVTAADGQTSDLEHRFAGTAPLAADGYEALVQAEIQLLRQLAVAIAETVGT